MQAYREASLRAKRLLAEGGSIQAIDGAIKINDEPYLEAMTTLSDELNRATAVRSEALGNRVQNTTGYCWRTQDRLQNGPEKHDLDSPKSVNSSRLGIRQQYPTVFLMAIIPISIVLFVLVTVSVSRSITRPLRAITDAAGKIAMGNIDQRTTHRSEDETDILANSFLLQRAQVYSKDEVGILAVAFNQMMDSLTSVQDTLENRAKELHQEVQERKAAEQQLADQSEQLRKLASKLVLAEEQTRREIGRDLHDHIGQILALAQGKLGTLRASEASEALGQPLEEIHALLEQTIRATRSLTFELSSPVLYELGLEAALESLSEQMEQQHGLRFHFETDAQPKPLVENKTVVLYRIARELLVNSSGTPRHATYR